MDNGQWTYIYIYCYDLNLDPLCELWPHCTRAHTVTGMQPHSTQISITLTRPFDFFWERKERNTNKESFHYWKQTIMRCQCPTWSIMPHVLSLSLFFFSMHVQLSCLNFQQLMLCSLYVPLESIKSQSTSTRFETLI